MNTSIENCISIKIYADDCFIGSSLLGYQDSLLSHFFGVKVISTLLPNCILKCTLPDEIFLLDVVFEDD